MGKYKVPHFDAKGEADRVFTESKVPTTFLVTSFYWENLIYFGMAPKRGPDGKLAFTLPMGNKKLASVAAEDIGKTAYSVFKQGQKLIGTTVGVAGDHLTGSQMAASLNKVLGEEVRYNDISPEAFRAFGFPGADDLGNMFQFNQELEEVCLKARNLAAGRELNPAMQRFWLAGPEQGAHSARVAPWLPVVHFTAAHSQSACVPPNNCRVERVWTCRSGRRNAAYSIPVGM